jgi:hypothetical protein
MLPAVIALALFGCIALGWSSARAAAEIARFYGQRACDDAGVQWLDQTVMLESLTLRRAHDGRVRIARRYRFDYSINGHDRRPARLALLGRELQWVGLPQPVPSEAPVSGANAES